MNYLQKLKQHIKAIKRNILVKRKNTLKFTSICLYGQQKSDQRNCLGLGNFYFSSVFFKVSQTLSRV